PGPFTDTVDGAFYLACPVPHGREAVCYGKPQVVMTMNGEGRARHVVYVCDQVGDELAEFVGNGASHRISDVDRPRTRPNGFFEYPAQELPVRPRGIGSRKLDVFRIGPGTLHRVNRLLQHLIPCLLQLVS